jgi:hypothetical protein
LKKGEFKAHRPLPQKPNSSFPWSNSRSGLLSSEILISGESYDVNRPEQIFLIQIDMFCRVFSGFLREMALWLLPVAGRAADRVGRGNKIDSSQGKIRYFRG